MVKEVLVTERIKVKWSKELHEEAYTSNASFLDLDKFSREGCTGRRLRSISENGKKHKCNLYKRSNGSYNIARKAVPDAFAGGIGVDPAFRHREFDVSTEPNKPNGGLIT